MREAMRYMTVKERELYDQLAEKYKIKGYSAPISLSCYQPDPESQGFPKVKSKRKKKER